VITLSSALPNILSQLEKYVITNLYFPIWPQSKKKPFLTIPFPERANNKIGCSFHQNIPMKLTHGMGRSTHDAKNAASVRANRQLLIKHQPTLVMICFYLGVTPLNHSKHGTLNG
jgi:hypothetical protein